MKHPAIPLPHHLLALCLSLIVLQPGSGHAATPHSSTDWFRDAGYGVFMHFLPGNTQDLARVRDFDVEALVEQLQSVGAGYFVLTLGQNSGFMNSPNPTYDRRTGYAPGERCATRDLPLDLYRALNPKGIQLMLYLPCQVPNGDPRAQKAFGLPQGAQDQPIDVVFAEKWAEVIHDWSARYGDKVAGWWFDGGYEWVGKVLAQQGVVTLDVGPNWNPDQGPVGAISAAQMAQLQLVQAAAANAVSVRTGS